MTVPVLLHTALSYYQLLCSGLVWSLLLWAALLKHDLKNLAKRFIHSKKLRKSSNSVWEGDTSMSPRCSEMLTFFEKVRMPLRIAPLLEGVELPGRVWEVSGAGRCVY